MKVIQKINGKLKILSLLLLFIFIQIISLGATLTVDTTKTRVGVPLKIMVNFTNEKKQEYKIAGIENFINNFEIFSVPNIFSCIIPDNLLNSFFI